MQRNPSSRRPPVLRQPAQQERKVVAKKNRRFAPKQAGRRGLPR
jgi:hypothetical protein